MSVPAADRGVWPTTQLPERWKWEVFDRCFVDATSRKKLPQKEYLTEGKVAVVDQGEDLVGGFTNDEALTYDGTLPVIVWGDHTKVTKFVDFPFVQGADGVKVLRPKDEIIDPRFAYEALKTIDLPDKGDSRHFKFLKASLFPAPPIDEQRRIVAKLDSLFERLKSTREELARIPRLVGRYKQALLSAAFQGSLTQEDGAKWQSVSLGDAIAGIDAGKNVRCEERPPTPHERGIVKVSSVSWGHFNPLASKTPSIATILGPSTLIKSGDFLISRANTLELVGACVIVGSLDQNNLYLSDKVLRIRFMQPIEHWVLCFLRSKEGRAQIENLATGNQLSMRNISQAAIKAIRIPLPPDEVRNQVLNRVKKALASAEGTLREATRAQDLLDRLDQSTLTKAFRGELFEKAS